MREDVFYKSSDFSHEDSENYPEFVSQNYVFIIYVLSAIKVFPSTTPTQVLTVAYEWSVQKNVITVACMKVTESTLILASYIRTI